MPGAFETLEVKLKANTRGFQRDMALASASTGKFASSAGTNAAMAESRFASSSKRIGGSMKNIGGSMMGVGMGMSKYVTLPLVAAGVAAVKFAGDYEQALTNAVSVTGLTGKAADRAQSSMDGLAKKMGRETAFSAQDAAGAMYDLASSGWKASDMGKGLRGIMDLASATQSDLSKTTSTVTATLGQFGMKAGDSGKVADIFTKAIGSSKANMDRLSSSMKTVGPVAHALGMPLTDTTAILSKLYDAGFEGEAAGTALRGSLSALMNPVGQTKVALDKMGLSIADVNPKTHKFTDVLRTLTSHGMDAKTAVQLFGREGAPAMLAVANQAGGIDKLSGSLRNAGGAAKQVADRQLNTFSGQMTILKGSLQTAAIVAGQKFTPMLKGIAQFLIPLVNGFASLPAPMMAVIIGIAGVAAAAGPLILGLGAVISALGTIVTVAPAVGAAVTVMTGPIGLAVIGIAALAAGAFLIYKNWGTIAPWLGKQWTKISSGVVGLKDTVVGGFKRIGGQVLSTVSGIPASVGGALSSLPSKVGPALGTFAGTVAGYIVLGARAAGKGASTLVGNVVGWIKKLPARTAEGFSSFASAVSSFLGTAAKRGPTIVGGMVSGIVEFVKSLPGRAARGLSGFAAAVGSGISRAAKEAPATVGRMVNGVVGWVKALPGRVGKAISGLVGSITGPFTKAYDRVVGHSIVPDMVRGVVNWFTGLPGKILKAITNMPGVIGRQFTKIKDKALAGLSGLKKGASNLAAGAGKGITIALSGAADKGSRALGWLRDKGSGALSGLKKKGVSAADTLRSGAVGQFEKMRSGGYGKIGKLAADGVSKFWGMEKKGLNAVGSLVGGGISRYEKLRKGGSSRFGALKGAITGSLGEALDKGSARIRELGGRLFASFKNQSGEAGKRFTEIRSNISTKLQQGKEWGSKRIHELGSNLFTSFKNQANEAYRKYMNIRGTISTTTKQARDWGSDRMRELGKTMKSVWDTSVKAAGNFGNSLHSTIKDKFGWVVNTARYWMGGLMVAVGRVLSAIGAGDLGGKAESYGGKLKAPLKFAKGGIYSGDSGGVGDGKRIMAITNEAGPEGVMPLDRATPGGQKAFEAGLPLYGKKAGVEPPRPRGRGIALGPGYSGTDGGRYLDWDLVGNDRTLTYKLHDNVPAFKRAAASWNSLGQVRLQETSSNSPDANVHMFDLSGNDVGLTTPEGQIYGDRSWFAQNRNYPENRQHTWAHELGHALGLGHPGGNYNDTRSIMGGNRSAYPQQFDIDSYNHLWNPSGGSGSIKSPGGDPGGKTSKPLPKSGFASGRLSAATSFANGAVGTPYVLGAVGPDAYDCSGFMAAIQNVLQGRSPHQRLYSTESFYGSGPPGWQRGDGEFTVGVHHGGAAGGHMAGTLAGMNVESTYPAGTLTGSKARGAHDSYFPEQWFLGSSGSEWLKGSGGGGGGSVFDWLGAITSGLAKVASFPSMTGDLGKGLMTLGPMLLGKAKDWLVSKAKSLFGSVVGGIVGKFTGGNKPKVAAWMAGSAESRGMPGPLPVMTALTESELQNLNYGDGTSLGYFQQTDNGAWGTAADRMNPEKSLGMFLDAAGGYKGQFGTDAGGLGAWAQAVQRSAYPDRYAQRYGEAISLIKQGQNLSTEDKSNGKNNRSAMYSLGGEIPGPKGQAVTIRAHSGERVLSAALADPVYRLAKSAEVWSANQNGRVGGREVQGSSAGVEALARRLETKLDERMKQAERHTAEQVRTTVDAVYAAQMSDLGGEILDRMYSSGLGAHDPFVAGGR